MGVRQLDRQKYQPVTTSPNTNSQSHGHSHNYLELQRKVSALHCRASVNILLMDMGCTALTIRTLIRYALATQQHCYCNSRIVYMNIDKA
jgi:hypothetical protein